MIITLMIMTWRIRRRLEEEEGGWGGEGGGCGGGGKKKKTKNKVLENEDKKEKNDLCLLVGCLSSQQHPSVSQGRICSDNFTCCHTEIEVADQTFYLTQSQYTDTGPTSYSADLITPGA